MKRLLRAGLVFVAVAVGLLVAADPASAGGSSTPMLGAGSADADWGRNTGSGQNFTPGGTVDVYVYDGSVGSLQLITSTTIVATMPFHFCTRYYCANYAGGDISWSIMIENGYSRCGHQLWVFAWDESARQATSWVSGLDYCIAHGG